MCNLAAACVLTITAAEAETITIVALGDSLTQGFGLPVDEGFVPQLEAWLTAQGADAEVINAGVSGDTTQGGLSRVAWSLTPEVDAMIVTLGGNDLLRGLDPAMSRSNIEGILSVAAENAVPVLLSGMSAPGNYGPDYKEAFDAIYPDLSDAYGTLYLPGFLAPILELEDRAAALRTYMQRDGIHPNAEGVALIVEAMGPVVLELVDRAREGE